MSNDNEQPHDPASSRPSRLGKASLVLGTIGLVMILILPCGYIGVEATEWDKVPVEEGALILLVMAIPSLYVAPALGLIGSCLAVAALLRKNRRRGASIAGLILSLTTLLAFGLLLLWIISMMEGVGAG